MLFTRALGVSRLPLVKPVAALYVAGALRVQRAAKGVLLTDWRRSAEMVLDSFVRYPACDIQLSRRPVESYNFTSYLIPATQRVFGKRTEISCEFSRFCSLSEAALFSSAWLSNG